MNKNEMFEQTTSKSLNVDGIITNEIIHQHFNAQAPI